MANELEVSPLREVCTTIARQDFKERIAQALPSGVSVDRFTRVVLTAIQQNPGVAQGERQSLYNSVIRCAQDGLLPDGKQAALVMFGNKVQYMPMIGGLRSIAAKHGIAMATGVVHKNDLFDYELGIEPRMTHKPAPLDADRGKPIGAWAQAKDPDGNVYLEVMGLQDIEAVRSVSRAKNGDLWSKWWGEAARKTVGRRLFKSLPLGDLDEREQRIIESADAEIDFNRQPPVDAPPAPTATGPRRPAALQRVVDSTATRLPPETVDDAGDPQDDEGPPPGHPAAATDAEAGDHF